MPHFLQEARSYYRRAKIKSGRTSPALQAILKNKAIFVHIPKCGGKSVVRDLYGIDEHEYFGHADMGFYRALLGPKKTGAFMSFTVVRDPVDRCKSGYRFMKEGGFGFAHDLEQQRRINGMSFDEFVVSGLLQDMAAKSVVFRPQSDFASGIDSYIRFEDLEGGLREKFPEQITSVSHVNASKVSSIHHVSDEAESRIREIYDSDYNLLTI